MDKLICGNVFVPLRLAPSHKSEQGSQILFGEKYLVIDSSGSWLKVRNEFDGYEGWIDGDHHLYYPDNNNSASGILAKRTSFTDSSGNNLILEPGSEIYMPGKKTGTFCIGDACFESPGKLITHPGSTDPVETAKEFLNSPYLWGGRTTGGMDCSGLTQLVYKIHGIALPRDSFKQAEIGETISFINEAMAGDLLFFDNESGIINHVGIYMGNDRIIHCSGSVRTDRIDHQGIFIESSGNYTHRLRLIKRIKCK